MSMGKQLVFNTTDDTASDNVGAYVRDSAGNLIPSQTISATHWLQTAAATFDGSGNAINSTSNALNVFLTNTPTFDVGTADGSAFTAGSSIEQPVGGFYSTSYTALTSGHTGAFAMTAFRAMSVNINDASGNVLIGQKTLAGSIPVAIASDQSSFPIKVQDGSGNSISSTGGSLNVDVTNTVTVTGTVTANAGTGTFTVSDAALANTDMAAAQQAVTGSAAALIASPLANRKYLFINNSGSKVIYIGKSGVTTATGFPIQPGNTLDARIGASVNVFAISASGTQTIPTLELS